MASTTDPADEAGGEVIYSSDGLEPIPVAKPPSVPTAATTEDVLDSEDISAQTAFELFQGRVYTTSNVPTTARVINETPLDKLARLQKEVTDLEAEWKASTTTSGNDFDEQLVQIASGLKTRLNQVSTAPVNQDDLTRLIGEQLQSLQTKDATAPTTDDTGVVYELYGNAAHPTSTMEDRLVKLERSVGSAPVDKTLLARLEEMEALVQTVDAATMEQTATKAKVIRADLEAASKAKNKLAATYKKEDSKMIQQLHQQLVDLEGLSGYLPALVDRLQQLSALHVQAGSFASRLESLEATSNQLSHMVGKLETSMEGLQDNLVHNVATMEGNLKFLDERLNKL